MNNNLKDKRIVIAGGSGFLGLSMAESFRDLGAEVTILSRRAPKASGDWKQVVWDGRTLPVVDDARSPDVVVDDARSPDELDNEEGLVASYTTLGRDDRATGDWLAAIDGCDAVVNLAGRTVNCIKTPDHCDEILRSRVESTRVLGLAMREVASPPPVWVQMSTAHIYGDPPSAVCTEESAEGYGLAPTVARAWEAAFAESKLPDQRGVVMRTSFVVGRNRGAGGGALGTLKLIANLGLGGKVAGGTQGMSWIHEDDINAIFARAILDDSMSGAYIISSPNPESQAEFMRTLRKVIGMPIGLPAFEWMVRIGAPLLMRTDPELVLYGRYVIPKRLLGEGFEFRFPELEPALRDLCGK